MPADEIKQRVEAVLELVGLTGYGDAADPPALGRPAAARGAGALAGAGAEDPAARRALRQPRPAPARAPARGGPRHPAAAEDHHAVRHPRPGRGARAWPTASSSCATARWSRSAAPDMLYREPATPFVAGFIGTMNLIEGTVADGTLQPRRLHAIPLPVADGPATFAVRPEALGIAPAAGSGTRQNPPRHRLRHARPSSTSNCPTGCGSRRWCPKRATGRPGSRSTSSRAPSPPIATTPSIYRSQPRHDRSRSAVTRDGHRTVAQMAPRAAGAPATRCSPARASSRAWRSAPASRSISCVHARARLRGAARPPVDRARDHRAPARSARTRAAELRALHLRGNDGTPIADHVMLLEDLCALLAKTPPHPDALLQLDYKEDDSGARRRRRSRTSRAASRRSRAT